MSGLTMEWLIAASAGLCVAFFCFFVLDRDRRNAPSRGDLAARIPAFRELAILIGTTPALAMLAAIGATLALSIILSALQNPFFGFTVDLVLLVALLFSAPMLARLNRARYLRRFESQLSVVIDQMISRLRGSRTLAQAIIELPPFLPDPAAAEMFEIADRSQHGLGLEEALARAGQKYSSRNFSLLLAVFRIFVRQGGNVVVPLQAMSSAYKDLIKADDFVRTASTQARSMFWMINGAIAFIFAFLSIAQPQLITQIFETPMGILAFLLGLAVYVGACTWMWQMMRVDV